MVFGRCAYLVSTFIAWISDLSKITYGQFGRYLSFYFIIIKFCCYALLQPSDILFVIDLLFHREICTTMPTKRILPLWTSFLESQLCSVCWTLKARIDSIEDSFYFQNLSGHQKWPGWTSFLALEASVDFALVSALCPLLRFFTGSLSGFARTSDPSPGWSAS